MFSSSLRPHVICYLRLKIASLAFFTPVFFFLRVCKGKVRVTAIIKLYKDETLDEEDVLMIFDQYNTFVNLVLVKTTFPQNFFVDEHLTTRFPPALHVTDNYACIL